MVDEGERFYCCFLHSKIHLDLIGLTMFKEGHHLGGVSLEGDGVEQVELTIGDSEVLINLSSPQEKEGFFKWRRFAESPIENILNEV